MDRGKGNHVPTGRRLTAVSHIAITLKPPPNSRHSEIDYTAEAANAQRFVELYGGLPDIFVPRVYTELSTRKVRRTNEETTDATVIRPPNRPTDGWPRPCVARTPAHRC